MTKEKTSGQKQSPGNKGKRAQIGGTAIPGAKSTQPKQISNSNNPQQQERESANRTARRRMEQLGTGPQQGKTIQERRQDRRERIKERQQAEVAAVKRSLPGGKLATDTRRVYYLIGGLSAAIILLIVVFIILRAANILH